MQLTFYKYQGTGNDFVIIDNRNQVLKAVSTEWIKSICDRRFGVGADGLMLLENHAGYDFEMRYYNSDGKESSMCGNGGRCIAAFAISLGISKNKGKFLAVDGEHEFKVISSFNHLEVSLKMMNVQDVEIGSDYYYLNTGSPHYVSFQNKIATMDLVKEARAIRFSDRFKEKGTNVNFVEFIENKIYVRTYERGVEDETLSCGTGVTAAALAAALIENKNNSSYEIITKGGLLNVFFKQLANKDFEEVWLQGPAEFVFKGEIEI